MDKRKISNKQVKDKLLCALVLLVGQKEWSKITVTELIETSGVARASFYRNFKTIEELGNYGLCQMAEMYHNGHPPSVDDFHNRQSVEYKFSFYGQHSKLILAFHRAQASISLLDVITDCVINANGDMPANSISKYELYYYAGAFYNMVLCWLENGTKESPKAMADEFLRISGENLIL